MNAGLKSNSISASEISPAEDARRICADVIKEWPDDSAFDTSSVLKSHPELRSHKSVVVDLAFEEYTRRRELGEDLTPTEFASRFPTIQKSLVKQLQVCDFLFDNSLVPPTLAETVWPEAGSTFLNFNLLTEIGRGSFSRVFLAEETDLGNRQVVVKICVGGAHEANILGRLEHDGIVPVYSADLDVPTGLSAICMPYVGRTTLIDVLDKALSREFPQRADRIAEAIRDSTPLVSVEDTSDQDSSSETGSSADPTPASASTTRFQGSYVDGIVTLAADLVAALNYSHGEGIVHSDIKPTNVLLTPAGQAMLIDFNLSHGEDADLRFGGTFPYMAPEQLRGLTAETEAETVERDIRTDIYALGATLFELLTGILPFETTKAAMAAGDRDEERAEIATRLLERQQQGVPAIRELNPQVDLQLASIIEGCLAFDPADRWQTPELLAQALTEYQRPIQQLRRWFDRNRRTLLAVASVLLVSLGAIGGYVASREPEVDRQMRLGQTALLKNEAGVAIGSFNLALKEQPDSDKRLDILLARGQAYLKTGEIDKALTDFREVEKLRQDPLATAAVGYCRAMKKQYVDGIKSFQTAAARGWNDPLAYSNNVGYCLLKGVQYDLAEEQLAIALRMAPTRQIVLHNLGMLNFHRMLRRQPFDLTYIVLAAEAADPSAELWLDVAATFSRAAGRILPNGQPPDQEQLAQCHDFTRRAVAAAVKAIQLGASPVRIQNRVARNIPKEAKKLKEVARLEELTRLPKSEKEPPPVQHFISPFEKVTASYLAALNRDS